jgi:hypothetical protein
VTISQKPLTTIPLTDISGITTSRAESVVEAAVSFCRSLSVVKLIL